MATIRNDALGFSEPLLTRARQSPMLMANGNRYVEMTHLDAVTSIVAAWEELKKDSYRKMFRWSWLSRGLASKNDMLAFNPGLSLKQIEEEMQSVEHAVSDLEGVGDVFVGQSDGMSVDVELAPRQGVSIYVWQISVRSLSEEGVEDWICMPRNWQDMLNEKFAKYRSLPLFWKPFLVLGGSRRGRGQTCVFTQTNYIYITTYIYIYICISI